ncbi:MAG: preprotein translocase subunit YajC [Leptospiraceae bacterium]|nr:preprotein translocase subunit YajC [Leptospiraceae bacterium]MDW8305703.1 preprotein translocase subunit YajC [Leptospiraceae bacterium]
MSEAKAWLLTQAAPVTTNPAPQSPQESAAQPSPWTSLLFPVLLVAIFYFLLIRPQQKKEKKRQEMLKQLAKGDKVLTRGGIWGVVVGVRQEEGIAVVKIAENVKVEVAIQAIELVNPSPEEAKSAGAEAPKTKASPKK